VLYTSSRALLGQEVDEKTAPSLHAQGLLCQGSIRSVQPSYGSHVRWRLQHSTRPSPTWASVAPWRAHWPT
jgi:hypothetical protein